VRAKLQALANRDADNRQRNGCMNPLGIIRGRPAPAAQDGTFGFLQNEPKVFAAAKGSRTRLDSVAVRNWEYQL
jgi:hypothetical protein